MGLRQQMQQESLPNNPFKILCFGSYMYVRLFASAMRCSIRIVSLSEKQLILVLFEGSLSEDYLIYSKVHSIYPYIYDTYN